MSLKGRLSSWKSLGLAWDFGANFREEKTTEYSILSVPPAPSSLVNLHADGYKR